VYLCAALGLGAYTPTRGLSALRGERMTTRPMSPNEAVLVTALREANTALREAREAMERFAHVLEVKPGSERPELELVKREGDDA
jgi:hypothetical protein